MLFFLSFLALYFVVLKDFLNFTLSSTRLLINWFLIKKRVGEKISELSIPTTSASIQKRNAGNVRFLTVISFVGVYNLVHCDVCGPNSYFELNIKVITFALPTWRALSPHKNLNFSI